MDEIIYYNSSGNAADKKHDTAFAYLSSVHTTRTYQQFRQSPSHINSVVNLSIGNGSHTIAALPDKPLLHVYLYGKETPEQRIPIPEILTSLQVYKDTNLNKPTLLLGGSVSGRLYIWSLHSGLLLSVKQPHYQEVTNIECYSGFIATAGKDSRIVIQTMVSLLASTSNEKPFSILTDHTLPVTSLLFSKGLNNDIKLYSASLDSTVRCYSLSLNSASLISTFVAPQPVTSLAADPAFRSLYIGMDNGFIRAIPLYKINPKSHVIEAVGGLGRIITLKDDVDLLETFSCHSDFHKENQIAITQLKVSFDGTFLVSGDSRGSLFIIDISTKQISRKLKELNGPIANLELWTLRFDDERFERKVGVDKSLVRSIPTLKRNLCEEVDLLKEKVFLKLHDNIVEESKRHEFDMTAWLDTVKSEEQAFLNISSVDSNILGDNVVLGATNEQLKSLKKELDDKSKAFDELREKYDELLKEYTESVTK